jgi:orotate phosphoribosyltransferase
VSDLLQTFRDREALLEGHFQLSSGRHSDKYLQCARVLMDPILASRLGAQIADALGARLREAPTAVVAPALGGVVIGHETARGFACASLFTERDGAAMALRRGFTLSAADRVVVVEDVVTTGKSTREVMAVVEERGARVLGVGALVDRSGGAAGFAVPFAALLAMDVPTFEAATCPMCRAGSTAVKPGSRPRT